VLAAFLAVTLTQTPLTSDAWQKDLAVLKLAWTTLHPGLFRYMTPEQFETRFSAVQKKFLRPLSRRQGYLELSKLAAQVRCGHTYLNFFNQSKAVSKELFEGRDKLPFTFKWVGSRMIVLASMPPHANLPRGTEILKINGEPVARILRKLMSVARADGNNDNKRREYLEVTGRDGYEAFDVYYPLFYPVKKPNFALDVREPGQTGRRVTVGAVDLAERRSLMPLTEKTDGPIWTTKWLAPDVALLDMPGWALYNSKWNWKSYLNSFFDELIAKGTKNLIIDLRANEGGSDVGEVIIQRIATKNVMPAPYERIVTYRETPVALRPSLDTWDPSFNNWGKFATEVGPRRFVLKRPFDDDGSPIKPGPNPYSGKVFVLMSATNSSATFQFLSDVKREGLATLVGQTSGGNQRGINGGAFFFLRLPNSGLEIDLPLIGLFPKAKAPDGGIEPDVKVKTTVEAIAQGRDQELDALLKLIRA